MTKNLSQRAYAKHRGCSPSYINRLVSSGVIQLDKNGHINTVEADASIIAHSAGRTTGPKAKTRGPVDDSLTAWRKKEVQQRAKKLALANAEREGTLVNAAEMKFLLSDVFMRIRSRLLALPSKTTMELVSIFKGSQPDPQTAAFNLLTREVREALSELERMEVKNDHPRTD